MRLLSRRGFTLVELLVVVVLGGFLVLSIYQVLITHSRTYSVNAARILGQQSLRAGMDVLFGELREVSTRGGDLVAMGRDSLTIRTQRAFGLVCSVDYTVVPPRVRVVRMGRPILAGDSVFVFADNNPERSADDVWLARSVQSADTTVTCSGRAAVDLRIPQLASSGDTVRVGAPIRAFQRFTYGLYRIDGEWYLGRRNPLAAGSRPDPLVGPLRPDNGLEFRYLDSRGQVTAVDSLVAQIQVTLRYLAPLRGSGGQPVADSLVSRIFLRN